MPENAQSAGQRDRSPSYPLIPLEKALDRLRDFEGHFKRNPAYPDKIGAAWDMTSASAVGRIVAALRYFGLLEYQKTGNRHQVSVSEEGRKYLRAQQEEIKAAVIRAAALRPKQIAKYWDKWGEDRPADNVCLDELILNNAFSDRGARRFLKVYDSTITFAGLVQADKLPEDDEGNESNGEDTGLDPDQRGDTPLSQAHLATLHRIRHLPLTLVSPLRMVVYKINHSNLR